MCVGECKAESDAPGICQAADCSHKGKSLAVCYCEDGRHEELETKLEDGSGGSVDKMD